LGKADYSGWGLFIDEGGDDQYQVKEGVGRSSEHGLGAFFDLNGQDSYELLHDASTPASPRPVDGKVILYPEGGLFVDR
jgi:hypothetical protein